MTPLTDAAAATLLKERGLEPSPTAIKILQSPPGTYFVYMLSWKHFEGGLQYIGITTDLVNRIKKHQERGRLPFDRLGEPLVEVLHSGLDVYAACDKERHEIMARRTMTPNGYNESLGGEYSGPRQDALFSSGHLKRLARATVGVEQMDGATHEGEVERLSTSSEDEILDRYASAVSVVLDLKMKGLSHKEIGRQTGLGHGTIHGMVRDSKACPFVRSRLAK